MSPAGATVDYHKLVRRYCLAVAGGASRSSTKEQMFRELQDAGLVEEAHTLLAAISTFGERMGDQNINISGGNLTGVNFGSQVGNISASVGSIAGTGENGKAFVDAVKGLCEAIAGSNEIGDGQKKELLDSVGVFAEEAKRSPEDRRGGVFKASLDYTHKLLAATAAGIKIWETFGQPIRHFFGLS